MPTAAVTKRTTARRAKASKDFIDIDAMLAEEGIQLRVIEDIPTFEIGVFGEKFQVIKAINVLSLVMADTGETDDSARLVTSIINMVAEPDRKRFKNAYARQPEVTAEQLGLIIRQMVEGAAGAVPSSSPPDSGGTAKARGSLPRSTGG